MKGAALQLKGLLAHIILCFHILFILFLFCELSVVQARGAPTKYVIPSTIHQKCAYHKKSPEGDAKKTCANNKNDQSNSGAECSAAQRMHAGRACVLLQLTHLVGARF